MSTSRNGGEVLDRAGRTGDLLVCGHDGIAEPGSALVGPQGVVGQAGHHLELIDVAVDVNPAACRAPELLRSLHWKWLTPCPLADSQGHAVMLLRRPRASCRAAHPPLAHEAHQGQRAGCLLCFPGWKSPLRCLRGPRSCCRAQRCQQRCRPCSRR